MSCNELGNCIAHTGKDVHRRLHSPFPCTVHIDSRATMRLLRPLFISISACKGLGLVSARPFPQGGETTAVEPIPSSVASTPTAAPLTISRLIATGSQVLPFASFQYGATGGPNTTLLFSGPVTLTASEVTLTLTEGFSPTTQTYPATTVTRNQTGTNTHRSMKNSLRTTMAEHCF